MRRSHAATRAVTGCAALLFGALLGGLLGPPAATARPREGRSDPAAVEQSARLLGDARTALAAGDSATAQKLAAQAYRSAPSPEGLFLLGQVALAENRLLDAQDFMRRYLADPNLDAPLDAEAPVAAQKVLERPRPKAAQLNILGDRSTVVSIDERLVGVLPLTRPLLVTPGEHKVVLERRSSRLEDQVRVPLGRLGEVRCNFATKSLVLTVLPGVLLVDDSPALALPEQAALLQHTESAVVALRLSPIGPRDAAECVEPAPGACSDAVRCQVTAAQRCEADYVLRTRVLRDGPATAPIGSPSVTLRVEAELIDVVVGEVAAKEQIACAGCAPSAALAKLKEQLETVISRGVNRPHGQLEVSSEPVGALVTLDGRAVGSTPYKAELFVGPHQIDLKKPGYEDFSQPVNVVDGQTAQVASNLIAVVKPEAPPPPKAATRPPGRPLWRLISGGVAIGAGAVLVGFGSSALAINGHCLDAPLSPATSTCPTVFKTTGTGGALLGIGGALMVGGAVLIALPPKTAKTPKEVPPAPLEGLARP